VSDQEPATVQELVESARRGKISRRRLIIALSSLGITAAGAAAIAATVASRSHAPAQQQLNQQLKQHEQHIAHQAHGDLQNMMQDYHDDAVVVDPLFAQAFVGKEAIARRFAAEVASVPDRVLRINNRFFAGNELIVEWEAAGTHAADFLGFGGTGRPYTLKGVTVVTRQNGKIVRESHYYDVALLRGQVESSLV
jgi:steroid delta-isomerase-like uncharacterized protein